MAKEDLDDEFSYPPGRGAEMLGAMLRLDAWVNQELRGRWRADLISRWILFGFFAIGLFIDSSTDWTKSGFTIASFVSSVAFTLLAAYLVVDKQNRRP